MAENIVPQVDYTSRDYVALRDEMLALIPFFAPKWTNRDPSDFGVTLVELFAYMGDQLNYYIDRSLNEGFISTASQRESVLRIARILGYTPTDATASTVLLTFQNSTDQPITVPARTKVSTTIINTGESTEVFFETDSSITVPARVGAVNGSQTVTATQGETKGFGVDPDPSAGVIGISDGSSNQFFPLPDSPIIGGSVRITVSNVQYTPVQYIIDFQSFDPVFTTITDSAGITYVQFGDGISGRIPNNGAEIRATYRVGGGEIGNVPPNTIRSIVTNAVSGLTVNNQTVGQNSGAASGGADPETTDSIRVNAPKSIRALSRAVSLSDYASLAIQVPGVAKANAISDVYSSVTIYIAPFGDSGLQVDGVTASTVFNNLSVNIANFFVDKTPPGTSITLQPPAYVDVKLRLNCVISPQYRTAQVSTAITDAIKELFDFTNVAFNDVITVQDVLGVLREIEGLQRSSLIKLIRKDEDKNFAISNRLLNNNTATLTTTVTHNIKVGETVLVSGVLDPNVDFNGTFVVTGVTSNTFSYSLIATNVTSAAVSPNGAVTLLAIKDIICSKNELPQLEVTRIGGVPTITGIELTTSGGIS